MADATENVNTAPAPEIIANTTPAEQAPAPAPKGREWMHAALQLAETSDASAQKSADKPADKTEDKVEEKAEEKPAEKPAADLSTIAGIARRERELRRERVKIETEKATIQQQLDNMKSQMEKLTALAEWDKKFQADPYAAAEERGLTYDKWTQYMLAGGKGDPEIQRARAEMQALRADIERRESERADNEMARQRQMRVAEYVRDLETHAAKDPILVRYGIEDATRKMIEIAETYAQSEQKVLDPVDAVKQTRAWIDRIAQAVSTGSVADESPGASTVDRRGNGANKRRGMSGPSVPDHAAASQRASEPRAPQTRDEIRQSMIARLKTGEPE